MRRVSDISGKIDLHIHSVISDGTDTLEELIGKVKTAGIKVFSVTDHDSFKSAKIMKELLDGEDGLSFISGAEFSCKDENGKYHILGYGFDTESADMNNLVEYGHSLRMNKLFARIEFLKSEFGFSFNDDDIKELLSLDNPGKPHIGNLMVKYGFADTKENAINNYINRKHFESGYLRPEEAISAIIAGGGIPVLAHPFYGSGDELIMGKDMDDRLKRLIGYGLKGLEAFYSGFSGKQRNEALCLAEKYDLFVTAGSDYHGKNKLVYLGDTGLSYDTEYHERLKRFLMQIFNK